LSLRLLFLRNQRFPGILEDSRPFVKRDLTAFDLEADPQAQGVESLETPVIGVFGEQLLPLAPALRVLAVVVGLRVVARGRRGESDQLSLSRFVRFVI
jgi:hypothetical protein